MAKIKEETKETGNVPNETIDKSVMNETDKIADEKEAKATAKELKKDMVKIKIPVDPQNPKDIVVPVMINGYMWFINRGETVEVPAEVANILENAKYI